MSALYRICEEMGIAAIEEKDLQNVSYDVKQGALKSYINSVLTPFFRKYKNEKFRVSTANVGGKPAFAIRTQEDSSLNTEKLAKELNKIPGLDWVEFTSRTVFLLLDSRGKKDLQKFAGRTPDLKVKNSTAGRVVDPTDPTGIMDLFVTKGGRGGKGVYTRSRSSRKREFKGS